jgi:GNAT superfamily N-acetyltransferase
MEIEIRDAGVEDAPQLAALSSQLGYIATAAKIRSRLNTIRNSELDVVYVAVVGGIVVGWVHGFCTVRLESGWFSEIGGIVVDQNYRMKTVGKRMIEQLKQWALAKGMTLLRVRVHKARSDAHEFYLGQGFSETKEQKVFDAVLRDDSPPP